MKHATQRLLSLALGMILIVGALLVFFNLVEPAYQAAQDLKAQKLGQEAFLDKQNKIQAEVQSVIDKAKTQDASSPQTLANLALPADKDEANLMDWLRFFLLCLLQQKNSLAERVKQERLMTSLSALDEQLLQLARQHGRLTLTAAQSLTKANRNTLKLHLRQLVQAGRLQMLGRGRSSWYEAV